MSSALQVLVHIPEIANYFLEGKFREDKRKLKIGCDISEEYYSVATYIWKGYNSTYKPDSFKANVQQYILIFLIQVRSKTLQNFWLNFLN